MTIETDKRRPVILLAEDEAMLRMVIVETLEDAGYEVVEAADGNAGLAVLEGEKEIDLLLSDIKMPGLNGYQLAEAALQRKPHTKVILMTGYANEAVPASIREIPVLYKPFEFDELPDFVARVMEQEPS